MISWEADPGALGSCEGVGIHPAELGQQMKHSRRGGNRADLDLTLPLQIPCRRKTPSSTATHSKPNRALATTVQTSLVFVCDLLPPDAAHRIVRGTLTLGLGHPLLADLDDRGAVDLAIARDFVVASVAGVEIDLQVAGLHHVARQRRKVPALRRLAHGQHLVGLDPRRTVVKLHDLGAETRP